MPQVSFSAPLEDVMSDENMFGMIWSEHVGWKCYVSTPAQGGSKPFHEMTVRKFRKQALAMRRKLNKAARSKKHDPETIAGVSDFIDEMNKCADECERRNKEKVLPETAWDTQQQWGSA